jgi:hypothetical protein
LPLDIRLQEALLAALRGYDFPAVTYDFARDREVTHESMIRVENEIRASLVSESRDAVLDGLSNVLYWGYARTGYRQARVQRFRDRVTSDSEQIVRAGALSRSIEGPSLQRIRRLRLPEFSGLSFISKVRMFLDPRNYVVVDRKLLTLRAAAPRTVLSTFTFDARRETSIRITAANERSYGDWCMLCRRIASTHLAGTGLRAVDMERGIFHLVEVGETAIAAEILAGA